jgi:hypothetical protein
MKHFMSLPQKVIIYTFFSSFCELFATHQPFLPLHNLRVPILKLKCLPWRRSAAANLGATKIIPKLSCANNRQPSTNLRRAQKLQLKANKRNFWAIGEKGVMTNIHIINKYSNTNFENRGFR